MASLTFEDLNSILYLPAFFKAIKGIVQWTDALEWDIDVTPIPGGQIKIDGDLNLIYIDEDDDYESVTRIGITGKGMKNGAFTTTLSVPVEDPDASHIIKVVKTTNPLSYWYKDDLHEIKLYPETNGIKIIREYNTYPEVIRSITTYHLLDEGDAVGRLIYDVPPQPIERQSSRSRRVTINPRVVIN